jgi:LPS-assembly lipoprotein
MMALYTRPILLVLLTVQALLIAGCGFQLRNQADLPPALNRIHIAGLSPYDNLIVALERALSANGVEVVKAEQATAILRITNRERGRRVLSVSTDSKARELELYTIVDFEVIGQGNALKLKDQRLTLTRDFIFDEIDVLAKASEAELLYKDMQDALVRLILYRLQAAG